MQCNCTFQNYLISEIIWISKIRIILLPCWFCLFDIELLSFFLNLKPIKMTIERSHTSCTSLRYSSRMYSNKTYIYWIKKNKKTMSWHYQYPLMWLKHTFFSDVLKGIIKHNVFYCLCVHVFNFLFRFNFKCMDYISMLFSSTKSEQ